MMDDFGAAKAAPAQPTIHHKPGAKRVFLCAAAPSIFTGQTILR
jgi:hypothetical protein